MIVVDKLLEKIGSDKALHFLVGALITSYSSIIDNSFMWLALFLVMVLSIIKEKLDTVFDYKDIFAALLGCIISIILHNTF
jgi:hypothetical protein